MKNCPSDNGDPDELETAAKIAEAHSDYSFAKLLRERAKDLRETQHGNEKDETV